VARKKSQCKLIGYCLVIPARHHTIKRYTQFKHHEKKGLVTVSCHKLSGDIAPDTLNSILKQAQIKDIKG
jgi:hypothetical protein